jgi:hypothetical protein
MKYAPLILLLGLNLFCSCVKEYPVYVFDNPYEENSGIEIFILDTFYFSTDHHVAYIFFKEDSMILYAMGVADSLVVFRDGAPYFEDRPKDHVVDLGVSPSTTYIYNFAFRDSTGALTKISQPFTIEVP